MAFATHISAKLWKKRSYIEISEEFRLVYDLRVTPDKSKLVKMRDNGMEEEVALIDKESVKIKLRLLRQFLAVKDMLLAVFFEMNCDKNHILNGNELRQIKSPYIQAASVLIFGLGTGTFHWMATNRPVHGLLEKIIPLFAKCESEVFPFNEQKPKYEEPLSSALMRIIRRLGLPVTNRNWPIIFGIT